MMMKRIWILYIEIYQNQNIYMQIYNNLFNA